MSSTPNRYQPATAAALLVAVMLSFQNCAKHEFSLESDQASLGLAVGDEGASVVDVTNPPKNVICDPFGSSTSFKAGIAASLTYYDKADAKDAIKNLNDIFSKGTLVKDTVILFSSIYVPTRSFTDGFDIGNGQKLADSNGNDLIEWFGLDFASNLQLMEAEEEGMYQMGTISDDGSILYVNSGAGMEKIVNNDGLVSTRMICGSVISLKKGDKLPMRLQYFQGPRTEIAVSLIWRKVSNASVLQPSYCGTTNFFSGGQPNANFQKLAVDGWKVLSAGNFVLKETIPNKCQ